MTVPYVSLGYVPDDVEVVVQLEFAVNAYVVGKTASNASYRLNFSIGLQFHVN